MSIIGEKKLPDILGNPQSARKTMDQLIKSDSSKAEEQAQKSMDFAIKMMLLDAKNSFDPFAEDSGGGKSNQMLQTANLIVEFEASKVQIAKSKEMAEAIKNPGYNALELQGKEVSYDNSKGISDGKTDVKFNYSLTHANEYSGAGLATTIEIKDQNGVAVYRTKGASIAGEHSFIWNGLDNAGNRMPAGTYNIEIQSTGFKNINGKQISFAVHASSVLKNRVTAVEVENGIVTKLVLDNGNIISKNQVKSVQEVKKLESITKLSSDLIAKNVELDLNRAQVINGDMDVYYNNHIANPGQMTVKVFDEQGKLVKTLNSNEVKKTGIDKVSFAKVGIPNGNYIIKVSLVDKDENDVIKVLEGQFNTKIVGINYINQTFITIDDNQFKAHNINAITAQYINSIDQRALEYQGAKVEYNDGEFTFEEGSFKPEIYVKEPLEKGDIIKTEFLRIYNQFNELVAEMKEDYNPYDQLDQDSKNIISYQMIGNWSELNADDKISINQLIEEKLADGTCKFASEEANLYEKGIRKLQFNAWDGVYGSFAPANLQGKNANVGDNFKYEHSTMYLKSNGKSYNGDLVIDKSIAVVNSVDKENGELFLNLDNGKKINENQVLRVGS